MLEKQCIYKCSVPHFKAGQADANKFSFSRLGLQRNSSTQQSKAKPSLHYGLCPGLCKDTINRLQNWAKVDVNEFAFNQSFIQDYTRVPSPSTRAAPRVTSTSLPSPRTSSENTLESIVLFQSCAESGVNDLAFAQDFIYNIYIYNHHPTSKLCKG